MSRLVYRFCYTRTEKRTIAIMVALISVVNIGSLIVQARSRDSYAIPTEIREEGASQSGLSDKLNIELNQADSVELLKLYGIGPVYSSRILKYRNLLGGYYTPEQLLEVYGMDSVRLEGFIANVWADTSRLKKMNIRTISFKELLHHPYISYEMVKAFVALRDRKGPPETIRTFLDQAGWSDSLIRRVEPYLSLGN